MITDNDDDCYRALGVIHRAWPIVPERFKDYISTPKRNSYRSLHTTRDRHASSMRIEVQIRTHDDAPAQRIRASPRTGATSRASGPTGKSGWLRDLIEIVDASHDAEELLEHTRLAIYQDRIFAFTPKGALFQLPKGATPVDFAFAVHTDLGAQTVGAKINGRHMPLRTQLAQRRRGRDHQGHASPSRSSRGSASSSPARRAPRSAARCGPRSTRRSPSSGASCSTTSPGACRPRSAARPSAAAVERLALEDEEELMYAIGAAKLTIAR